MKTFELAKGLENLTKVGLHLRMLSNIDFRLFLGSLGPLLDAFQRLLGGTDSPNSLFEGSETRCNENSVNMSLPKGLGDDFG